MFTLQKRMPIQLTRRFPSFPAPRPQRPGPCAQAPAKHSTARLVTPTVNYFWFASDVISHILDIQDISLYAKFGIDSVLRFENKAF